MDEVEKLKTLLGMIEKSTTNFGSQAPNKGTYSLTFLGKL